MTVRRGGVRFRTAAAASAAVAIFLALAAVAFALVQRHQLEAALTQTAADQANDLAAQIDISGTAGALAGGDGDQLLVQVVDAAGNVVTASPSVDGEPPVVSARPPPGETLTLRSDTLPIGEGEEFVVVARGSPSPDGPVVILVAQSLELVGQSTSVVVSLLAIGYPLVLIAVALTSYWFAGRALAPVEAIRARVADIEGTSALSSRVPVPDGNDEISRLATTMNAMLGRLHAASEAQQRFVGDASHELRSPLATIRVAHEIAALHPERRAWESTSRDVLAELDRIDRLVADMLLLARVDEHGLALRVVDVDLEDLVRDEAKRLALLGVIEVSVVAPPTRVQGDPDRLSRALRNLTDNAARHARARVDIRLRAVEGRVLVEVEDDGFGVSEADRARIFDRFVRLDKSRTRASGGTGLGLAIAREIAVAHHGDLVVEAGTVGARFVLSLPRP